ncbi:ThiF family adenylyltransferase [Sporomusa malonica]|uniref:ThiF family protein n=1 Tax=Sporomusa malonica TaxID=112901 RepID=A0A1W2E8F0_9FIRM|nr:ThiF family adenylyltransferase [Sporomusa malonica]SMD05338.1 ThiF family protein [Sporomusa malonica]
MDFLNRLQPLLQKEGLDILAHSYIALSGLGGVGGVAFQALVRSGVRRFRLAENGIFDPPDMNRQPGATAFTMGRPKLDVYVEWAHAINPAIELELYPDGINVDNIEGFLQGADAYIGVIDAEKGQDVKEKSGKLSARMGIPLFTAGAIGFGALLVNHHPDGMTPATFWSMAERQGRNGGILPMMIAESFHPEIRARIEQGFAQGILSTTAVGANMAGTVLANEVMTYLLQPLGWLDREPLFAPQYLAIDLLNLNMTVSSVED